MARVKWIMERAGIDKTGVGIRYIKDALKEINNYCELHVRNEKIDVTQNQRFYDIPNDALKVLDVKVLNHLNGKDEYRSIPRLIYEPHIEDANDDGDEL